MATPQSEREQNIDEFVFGIERGRFSVERDRFVYRDEEGDLVDVTMDVRYEFFRRATERQRIRGR